MKGIKKKFVYFVVFFPFGYLLRVSIGEIKQLPKKYTRIHDRENLLILMTLIGAMKMASSKYIDFLLPEFDVLRKVIFFKPAAGNRKRTLSSITNRKRQIIEKHKSGKVNTFVSLHIDGGCLLFQCLLKCTVQLSSFAFAIFHARSLLLV